MQTSSADGCQTLKLSVVYCVHVHYLECVSPIVQSSFKSTDGSPLGVDVISSPDNGHSNGMFTHSVDHAGKQVSVRALRHGDHIFVHLSRSCIAGLSKEWYVYCGCVYTCLFVFACVITSCICLCLMCYSDLHAPPGGYPLCSVGQICATHCHCNVRVHRCG